VTKSPEVPREAAFTATNVDCQLPRRGYKAKELIAVISPVAVVTGRSRPVNPLIGVRFPSIPEAHGPPDIDETKFCPRQCLGRERLD
jgi:hypothetical protein